MPGVERIKGGPRGQLVAAAPTVQEGQSGAGPVGEVVVGFAGVVAVAPAVQLPVLPSAAEIEFRDRRWQPLGHAHTVR